MELQLYIHGVIRQICMRGAEIKKREIRSMPYVKQAFLSHILGFDIAHFLRFAFLFILIDIFSPATLCHSER